MSIKMMMLVMGVLRAPNDGGGDAGGGGGDAGSGGAAPGGNAGGAGSGGQPAARQSPPPAGATFSDANDASGSDVDDDANDSDEQREAKAKAKAAAKPKYKTKRGGKEAEYDVDELVRMVSDDYEEELPGPGGKMTKLKRAELLERARQGEGFLVKMRQLAEREQSMQQEREHGKKDIWSYVESRLGVEDHRELVMQKARELYAEDAKIASMRDRYVEGEDGKLYQNPNYNPVEANRLMEQRAAAKLERKNALDKSRLEAEGRTRQQREGSAKRTELIGNALKESKVPVNGITMQLANEVIGEYQQARVKLSATELAGETRKRLRSFMHEYLSTHDDDSLLSELGDDFRKKLRDIEVAAAKGKKREAAGAKPPENNGGGNNGKRTEPKQLSDAEFRKQFRL